MCIFMHMVEVKLFWKIKLKNAYETNIKKYIQPPLFLHQTNPQTIDLHKKKLQKDNKNNFSC